MPLKISLEEMIRNALKGHIVKIPEEKAYKMFYEIQRKLKNYKNKSKQENTKSEGNSENCIVI